MADAPADARTAKNARGVPCGAVSLWLKGEIPAFLGTDGSRSTGLAWSRLARIGETCSSVPD
ncbi:hypothetical protein BQ8482_111861 [Mesorhizobium delmotii]|uniref:Uncharacterized protein n=1 Tax=Mesorhizobium delmotii TaxID=1631247 RepID=A0A2P9AFL2_9HYPH|nr:hypothetical protein BQ8482_111861 [Mesorhizobium delmotii]